MRTDEHTNTQTDTRTISIFRQAVFGEEGPRLVAEGARLSAYRDASEVHTISNTATRDRGEGAPRAPKTVDAPLR